MGAPFLHGFPRRHAMHLGSIKKVRILYVAQSMPGTWLTVSGVPKTWRLDPISNR